MHQLRPGSVSAFVCLFGRLVRQDGPFYSKFPMPHAATANSSYLILSTWTRKHETSRAQSCCLLLTFLPVSISWTCPIMVFLRDLRRSYLLYHLSDPSLRFAWTFSPSIDDARPRRCAFGPSHRDPATLPRLPLASFPRPSLDCFASSLNRHETQCFWDPRVAP